MASFEVLGKFDIKKPIVNRDSVIEIVERSLRRHYDENKIKTTPTGLAVKGNLKSLFAQAITVASVKIEVVDGQLIYRVDGVASLGVWPWVCFCIALLCSVVWGFWGIFLIWFLGDVISFFICRDKPKQYFEDAFKAVQFEIG